MTKLLILAYDFPPYVSVGGLRPYSWYKYLCQYDVYPIVFTRQWENRHGNSLDYISSGYSDSIDKEITTQGTIFKTPFTPNLANRIYLKHGPDKYKLIRKLVSSFYEFAQFVLPVGTKKEIYSAADDFLKHNKVDCIITTGDPFILFKYASELSRKYSIPWIADYRDTWVQDKKQKSKLYRLWSSFFERKFLKNAYKITTVSTFLQKQIEQNVKGKEFEILYNGYDPEIIEVTKDLKQDNKFLSIAFNGTISDWHPIENFLKTCNEVISENPDIKLKLNFYGVNKEKEIKELLSEHYQLLEKHTNFYSRMDNLEFAKSIVKQNVFLLFNDYSILGTKIFDYVALRRRILLCYEDDEESNKLRKNFCLDEMETESSKLQAEMITATKSGIIIQNSEHLKKTILELNDELNNKGYIGCQSVNTDKYSRIKQVKRLAEIVKEAG